MGFVGSTFRRRGEKGWGCAGVIVPSSAKGRETSCFSSRMTRTVDWASAEAGTIATHSMDPQNAVLKRREKQTLITINRSAQKSGNAYAAQGGREKPVLTASS